MRWYLAGPMSGIPEFNFPAFDAEAARLRSLGYDVINPAEINVDPALGWATCLKRDIPELCKCDGLALLPGWENSRGAMLEWYIAQALGMLIAKAEMLQGAPQLIALPVVGQGA